MNEHDTISDTDLQEKLKGVTVNASPSENKAVIHVQLSCYATCIDSVYRTREHFIL